MTNILETRNLSYAYSSKKNVKSLDGVSISIREGVRTAILGPNGAGKSTLFYSLNGILKPEEGEVLFKGVPLDYSRDALRDLRSSVCVVVQNPDEQIFSSTVEEDVAFGPLNMGLPREEIEKRIVDSLSKVGMLENRHRPTIHLSYGQRKRIALAGALAVDPDILILDEPTAGLDPRMSAEMIELIDALVDSGKTVILSTHDIDMAYAWAEDVHVISHGKHVYSGDPDGFFSDEKAVLSAGLVRPRIAKLHDSLGLGGSIPRTASQLLACTDGPTGKIQVRSTEDGPCEADGRSIGVYGPSARNTLAEWGVEADIAYDAVESACRIALSGEDVLVYAGPEAVDRVLSRIDALAGFGRCPEVVR